MDNKEVPWRLDLDLDCDYNSEERGELVLDQERDWACQDGV
jgi:hypothetical protein